MSDTLNLDQVGRVLAFCQEVEHLERRYGVSLTSKFRIDLTVDGALAGRLRRDDPTEGFSLQTSVVR